MALKVKQEAFCVAFTTIGADTFGHGINSAIAAGYEEKSARTQAWRLLKNAEITARILELYDEKLQENRVTCESVLANLAHDRLMARKTGQYSVAVRCTELEGRYLALFTDKLAVNPEREAERKKVTEQEAELFREWARKRCDELACDPDEPPVEQSVDEPKAG